LLALIDASSVRIKKKHDLNFDPVTTSVTAKMVIKLDFLNQADTVALEREVQVLKRSVILV